MLFLLSSPAFADSCLFRFVFSPHYRVSSFLPLSSRLLLSIRGLLIFASSFARRFLSTHFLFTPTYSCVNSWVISAFLLVSH